MAENPPELSKIERRPLPAQATAFDQGAVITLCLELNVEWFYLLAGWIEQLHDDVCWEGTVEDVSNSIDQIAAIQELWSLSGGCMPVGGIMWYGGTSPPAGWLLCDGSEVEQAVWPALYAAIGDNFGPADPGYFQLPDLRGCAAIGTGQGSGLTLRVLGDDGGAEDVALNVTQIPSHAHTTHAHLPGLALAPGELPVDLPNPFPGGTGYAGGGLSHQNMPPWLAVTAIIRGR